MNYIEVNGGNKFQRHIAETVVTQMIKALMPKMKTLQIEVQIKKLTGDAVGWCSRRPIKIITGPLFSSGLNVIHLISNFFSSSVIVYVINKQLHLKYQKNTTITRLFVFKIVFIHVICLNSNFTIRNIH